MAKTTVNVATGEVTIDENFELEEFAPTPQTIETYESAIQSFVDETARARQFRDGVTLASYVASTNPAWAAEAQAFVAWRDEVWAYSYQELARYLAGERQQPSIEQILSELPSVNWP